MGGYVGGYEAKLWLDAKEVLIQPYNNTLPRKFLGRSTFVLLLRAMCGYACGWQWRLAVAAAEVGAAEAAAVEVVAAGGRRQLMVVD